MPIHYVDEKPALVCVNLHDPRLTMVQFKPGSRTVALHSAQSDGRLATIDTHGILCDFYVCSVCHYVGFYLQSPEP